MDTKEVISIAQQLSQRGGTELANELIDAFLTVEAEPESPGEVQDSDETVAVAYPEYTVEVSAETGQPTAVVTAGDEELDRETGHDEVFELMGDYVHPNDRATVWSMLGDKNNT